MKALITTGGKGIRMQMHKPINKCLLEIEGKTILEHTVDTLKKTGIDDIHIITGFGADAVESTIGDQATYWHHKEFETMGMVPSLLKARDGVGDEDFVLIMGDSMFHKKMLERTVKTDEDIVVTYERKENYVPEDSKAIVEGDLIKYMGKDIPPADTSGEFGHMMKLTAKGAKILFEEVDVFIEEENYFPYLMDVINQIISKGVPVKALDITGIPRAEIDFQEDLADVKKSFAAGDYNKDIK